MFFHWFSSGLVHLQKGKKHQRYVLGGGGGWGERQNLSQSQCRGFFNSTFSFFFLSEELLFVHLRQQHAQTPFFLEI